MQLSETNKREEKLEETITFSLGDRIVAGYLSGGWFEKDMVKMMNEGLSEEDTIEVFLGELIGSPYNYYIMDLNTSEKIIELLKQQRSEM